jgi:hypothetical protein
MKTAISWLIVLIEDEDTVVRSAAASVLLKLAEDGERHPYATLASLNLGIKSEFIRHLYLSCPLSVNCLNLGNRVYDPLLLFCFQTWLTTVSNIYI